MKCYPMEGSLKKKINLYLYKLTLNGTKYENNVKEQRISNSGTFESRDVSYAGSTRRTLRAW